ncbi:hypothetical protein [Niabella aurantiaca]|uniref:hypothetical protein n=1 Tax=Niabella aurantiaca TaxID=379900 RepID=UPI00036F702D|nr:hypothetical protein [Niabella aurantiaca]
MFCRPFSCLITFTVIFLVTGCAVRPRVTVGQPKPPFKIRVIAQSREVVLRQTFPWEQQMMGYFKVLKPSRGHWQMWYSGWDVHRKDDYSGYLLYAESKDGRNWQKRLPGSAKNILRGTGHPQRDGIVEQDVFIVPGTAHPYKMIYTARDPEDDNKEKTYVEESADGIHWQHRKVLWNRKHDSQFSVIQKDNRFYIYLRYWTTVKNRRYRTIGRAVTDQDWNVIEEPVNIFTADPNSDFPHLYNPAASNITSDLDLLFPTFFNEATNKVRIGVLYTYRERPFFTSLDLTGQLLEKEKNNWAIVCPGLIPAGKHTYWLYYYATNMVHSDYDKSGRNFSYYRIKIKIIP